MPYSPSGTPRPQTTWGLTGGLVTQVPSPLLDPTSSDSLQNVVNTIDGRVSARPGLNDLTANGYPGQASPITHISKVTPVTATDIVMTATLDSMGNVRIFWLNGAVWTEITGALAPLGDVNTYMTAANFKGQWFFAPGDSPLLLWDTVSPSVSQVLNATLSLSAPLNPKIVMAASSGSHLFLLNWNDPVSNQPAPQGIAWSAFLDYTTWGGGTFGGGSGTQLLEDDNEPITAGTVFGPFSIVFKARKMYIALFQNAPLFWQFVAREEDRGCVAQGSIASYNNMRFWLGDDAVYMFDGNNVQAVSDRVISRFLSQMYKPLANRSFALVDRYNSRYHLFLPADSQAASWKLFTFHLKTGAWTEGLMQPPYVPKCAFQWRNANWSEILFVGTGDTMATPQGKYMQQTTTASTDAGTVYDALWESKIIDAVALFPGQAEVQDMQGITIHAAGGAAQVWIAESDHYEQLTQGNAEYVLQSGLTQTIDGVSDIEIPLRGRSRFIKVRVELLNGVQIEGWSVFGKPVDGRSGR